MKKNLFILLSLVASICLATAEESFDFTYSLPAGWSATVAPYGFEGGDTGRGAQFSSSSELTLPRAIDVKQVTIVCSTNSEKDNDNSIEVTVGSQSFGTKQLPKANDQTIQFAYSEAVNGDLKIIITKTKKKSVWIKTVTIDGTFDKSILPKEDPYEGLETEYAYTEPTKVVSTDTLGSKIPYSFIHNNVKVIASKGTKTQHYFGANANSMLTFATTRKMKALVVDGQVNKAFTATASSGKIAYKSSDAIDLEEEQVLAVTDIDSTILSLYCDAQLRCNEVRIYFDANPEIDINPGEDEQFSYDYEPEEIKTMNLTYETFRAIDMRENLGYDCLSLIFSNAESELVLAVFTSPVEGDSIPSAGTYPINDSYQPNTVQASPGGDEYMDYPSYLTTDYEIGLDGKEYYNPYYLVSGTLEVVLSNGSANITLHATSYYGSTINATFVRSANAVEDIATQTDAIKTLRDGQLLLRRGEATYTILGTEL